MYRPVSEFGSVVVQVQVRYRGGVWLAGKADIKEIDKRETLINILEIIFVVEEKIIKARSYKIHRELYST